MVYMVDESAFTTVLQRKANKFKPNTIRISLYISRRNFELQNLIVWNRLHGRRVLGIQINQAFAK